jgi:dCTP deaminase
MTSKPLTDYNGSVLSDRGIKTALKEKLLVVQSPKKLNIQPASLDVHLAKTIMTFYRRRAKGTMIDVKEPVDNYVDYETLDAKKGTILHPREFILGVTEEWFALSDKIIANVDGKSSLGRLGLVVHATAGFVDPGFEGHITLEMTNLTELPMVIYPGMPVGQIRFTLLVSPSEHKYGDAVLGSKKYPNPYSKNPKPIASQYWKNFK